MFDFRAHLAQSFRVVFLILRCHVGSAPKDKNEAEAQDQNGKGDIEEAGHSWERSVEQGHDGGKA